MRPSQLLLKQVFIFNYGAKKNLVISIPSDFHMQASFEKRDLSATASWNALLSPTFHFPRRTNVHSWRERTAKPTRKQEQGKGGHLIEPWMPKTANSTVAGWQSNFVRQFKTSFVEKHQRTVTTFLCWRACEDQTLIRTEGDIGLGIGIRQVLEYFQGLLTLSEVPHLKQKATRSWVHKCNDQSGNFPTLQYGTEWSNLVDATYEDCRGLNHHHNDKKALNR